MRTRGRSRKAGRALVVIALLLAATSFTGCGAFPGHALDGSSWRLVGWSAGEGEPSQFEITATFADGQIGGKSGVNSYGGAYTTGPGDAFSVGEMNSTLMAGSEPAMRAEEAYLKALESARSFSRAENTLMLYDEQRKALLTFEAAQ